MIKLKSKQGRSNWLFGEQAVDIKGFWFEAWQFRSLQRKMREVELTENCDDDDYDADDEDEDDESDDDDAADDDDDDD